MPRSSCRAWGFPVVETVGEPTTMGPGPGCGQAGQPCASASIWAKSPRRAAPGIVVPLLEVVYHSLATEGTGLPGPLRRVISRTPMFTFVIILHVVVSIFLIFVILLQP